MDSESDLPDDDLSMVDSSLRDAAHDTIYEKRRMPIEDTPMDESSSRSRIRRPRTAFMAYRRTIAIPPMITLLMPFVTRNETPLTTC